MASEPISALEVALDSLTVFEDRFEQVEVVSALLDQQYDEQGELEDIVSVGFRIRGRPGIFSVHPPLDINWQAQAFVAIAGKKLDVEGIYAGLASKAELPRGPVGEPLAPLGVSVAG